MSEIAAAIGLVQLTRIEEFGHQRNANSAALRAALANGDGFRLLPDSDRRRQHANYCLVAVLDESLVGSRNEIVLKMKDDGVGTSVYYPVPLPLSHFYSERYGHDAKDFPNASRISYGSIALPVGPHLNEDDMAIVADSFMRAVQEVS